MNISCPKCSVEHKIVPLFSIESSTAQTCPFFIFRSMFFLLHSLDALQMAYALRGSSDCACCMFVGRCLVHCVLYAR